MGDEGVVVIVQPVMRIIIVECPMYDVEAFVDDCAIGQQQDGDCAFGGYFEHMCGFVAQDDFAELNALAAGVESEAGAHGVGAAAEGVEGGRCHG